MQLTADDIRGVVGILPTPGTADAADWRAEKTVNLTATVKMVRAVVDAGIEIIMTTGTFGEGATLTWTELQDFVACVVDTTARRRPVFAGVTTLNTRDTISRGRRLMELGAAGLFIGRPMWLPLDERAIVRYYRDLAEALPGTPIILYDNPAAFKGKISEAAYRELAKIKELVGAKHAGGPQLEADLLAVGGAMRILPLETDWYALARKHPDAAVACWSGDVACATWPFVALSRAIARRDWANAERISARVSWAFSAMVPQDGIARFIDYSIPLAHVRFNEAGLINVGPSRPPYLSAPDDLIAGSKECGRRWAQLQKEFADELAVQA